MTTRCHRFASTCVNRFPYYAQCICDEGYVGNGRTHCDPCGLTFRRHNLRIIGGVEAPQHSWPSTVFIRQSFRGRYLINGRFRTVQWSSRCGGVLINHKTVLTASHCIQDRSFIHRFNRRSQLLPFRWNQWFPNLESTFTIYVGMHDIRFLRFSQKARKRKGPPLVS